MLISQGFLLENTAPGAMATKASVTTATRAISRAFGFSRHTSGLSDALKPPRDAWAQWISPETLIAQVRNAAPFLKDRLRTAEPGRLIELGNSSDGFLRILANWQNILRPGLDE